jgi:hypothetical protein
MAYLGTKPANQVIDSTLIADGVITPADLNQNTDFTFNGVKVGRGASAVSTNTAVGASALAANTSGAVNTALGSSALLSNTTASYNTAIGSRALRTNTTGANNSALGESSLYSNTTGSNNTAVGEEALVLNTTASFNTAVGYQAGYSNVTGSYNTFIGDHSGYTSNYSATAGNTCVGAYTGYSLTTGIANTFVGWGGSGFGGAGSAITTGSKNTILGGYSGNQAGYDIRTASNWIILSDGDGNPRVTIRDTGRADFNTALASGSTNTSFVLWNTTGADVICEASNNSPTAISGAMRISKNGSNNRSINAAGTVNQNGADYAEYMTKASDFTIAKGDVVGIDANGKLTNVFADAISFCVKSTDPGLVGGDTWFTEARPKDSRGDELPVGTEEHTEWFARMEAARATVDRIAFCGQVPVNVIGATAGQYIIPVNDNGSIKGEAVSSPAFEQYQLAVGKVIAIEADGRAKIIVKIA